MASKNNIIETQDFLLSVIESAPYGILTIDLQGEVTIVNSQVPELLNLEQKADDIVGIKILSLMNEVEELNTEINNCLRNGLKEFDIPEVFYLDKYLTFRGREISEGMIITIADITSIKEAQYSTLNSLLEGQEQERKRLAREIHDGIGPILSTVKMTLANIEGDLENIDRDLAAKFRKSYGLIDEAADDLRSISHNLMPKVLSDFGLVEALETLSEKINETKSLSVEFINAGIDERLDEITELGLYRISQELINNTLKHAQASLITIQLIKRPESIRLMYEDNGKGFNPDNITKGIGLANIEYRAEALECETIIESQPGKGMIATVEIPLDRSI